MNSNNTENTAVAPDVVPATEESTTTVNAELTSEAVAKQQMENAEALDKVSNNLPGKAALRFKPVEPGYEVDPLSGETIYSTAIVIKNIPFVIERDELMAELEKLDMVKPFALNYHKDAQGIFRGLAFANFETSEQTKKAITMINTLELKGRKIRAEPKKKADHTGPSSAPVNPASRNSLSMMKPSVVTTSASSSNSPASNDSARQKIMRAIDLLKDKDSLIQEITFVSILSSYEREVLVEEAEKNGLNINKNSYASIVLSRPATVGAGFARNNRTSIFGPLDLSSRSPAVPSPGLSKIRRFSHARSVSESSSSMASPMKSPLASPMVGVPLPSNRIRSPWTSDSFGGWSMQQATPAAGNNNNSSKEAPVVTAAESAASEKAKSKPAGDLILEKDVMESTEKLAKFLDFLN